MTVKYAQPVVLKQVDGKPHKITLQVSYMEFKPNSIVSPVLFDEKNFILVGKDGSIGPVKKYANYKLIIPNEDF